MDETGGAAGRGRAALIEDGVEFDGRDAALLRAVHEAGSVAGAAAELGRSRARALSRIEALETAFGTLVERRRGGSGGGGSRLSSGGRTLLDRYDRLQAVLAATASVPETVLDGTVASVDGELADVDTAVGRVRGLHGGVDGTADDPEGAAVGDAVQVRIGADAVTIYKGGERVDPDSTSARNRLRGEVVGIEAGETVSTVRVAVGGADGVAFRVLITGESAARLDLDAGDAVAIRWKATATRVVSQSTTSGRE
ncbi:TOBE domain-containing protein [Halorubrum kocurii]|uniref:Transcriptional regulator, ModE family protein n=1 Tax=Halorubrum kocurii JCM 14978 TaxID=1230456 RepID=M0P8R0_9EURY|nr:TOBE domain-containing protein [Halorubrum kocurii]EMA65215.1 transcriptional regulator, ModE family protein [Halorubrum kocurii JCM 14978]